MSGANIRELTVGRVLAEKAARDGDKVFLTWLPDGRRWTYRDIDRQSNALANGLLASGLAQGAHVAIMMENCPEQVLSFFALGKIGAVAVPINAAARGELLRYFIEQSDASAIVIEARYLERLLALGPELAARLRLVVVVPDESGAPPPGQPWRTVPFERVGSASPEAPPTAVGFRDMAMIMYTSGTTGPSKGCVFSQARTLLWGMSHAEALGYHASDVFYVCMPLFHVSALQGTIYNALTLGASVALQRRFSASGFWRDVRESGATVANMQGSMANILWGKPPSPQDGEHRLRMCQVSPCPEFALAFEERFRMRFVSGYGLTDYWSSHAFTLSDPSWKLGSAGRPRRGIEARVVDEDDFDVPTGEVGELILRNNNPWEAGEGYYRMPEASLASMRNGWFHTGDRVRIDEDGYLWFVGRGKDAIRRRGENISAFEIESVVKKHPAIADAAAYALPSELGEDDVALAVVPREGHELDEAELIRYCAANMAYFMVPRYVRRVRDLPRTLSHKVQKFRLREESERDRGDLWDREAAGIRVERS
ncbi:MAG TPA: AMP-binding protein [Burkholderiales bacterium]|nr:AMP-binding protein [Burkholderiales bacterium]